MRNVTTNRSLTLARALTLTRALTLALALAVSAATATLLAPAEALGEDADARDAVVLTDGRTITGEIVGEDEQFISIRAGGVLRAYPKDRVESVTRGTPIEAADPAPAAGETATPAAEVPGDTKKAAKKAAKKRARKAGTDAAPQRLSAEAQAWLTELLNRMRSPAARDPVVRSSLASALRAMGPTAVAPIRAAASDADPEIADVLKRTAAAIERGAASRKATSDRAPGDDAMGGERADAKKARRADVLASLGLSREQGREVKDVVRDHLTQRRDIYKEARAAGTAREDVAAQYTALRARTLESIRALLDPEQAEKFDAAADTLMETIESKSRDRGQKKAKKKKKEADSATQ